MARLGYCQINDLKLSSESLDAIEEIRYIFKQSNYANIAIGVIPLFDLFLDRSRTTEKLISIAAYDWQEFGNVLMKLNKVTRDRVRLIAEPLTWSFNGDEGDFWRCISDATL